MYYRDIDRMYRIETKGYNKVVIAKNYLWPKIRKQFNSTADGIIIPNEIIEYNASNKGITQGEEGYAFRIHWQIIWH